MFQTHNRWSHLHHTLRGARSHQLLRQGGKALTNEPGQKTDRLQEIIKKAGRDTYDTNWLCAVIAAADELAAAVKHGNPSWTKRVLATYLRTREGTE